jgi:hypothetical protein
MAMIMAIAVVFVSFFPLVDTPGLEWMKLVHRISSYAMFTSFIIFAFMTIRLIPRYIPLLTAAIALCVSGAFSLITLVWFSDFFWSNVLIIESAYVVLALLLFLAIPASPDNRSKLC